MKHIRYILHRLGLHNSKCRRRLFTTKNKYMFHKDNKPYCRKTLTNIFRKNRINLSPRSMSLITKYSQLPFSYSLYCMARSSHTHSTSRLLLQLKFPFISSSIFLVSSGLNDFNLLRSSPFKKYFSMPLEKYSLIYVSSYGFTNNPLIK